MYERGTIVRSSTVNGTSCSHASPVRYAIGLRVSMRRTRSASTLASSAAASVRLFCVSSASSGRPMAAVTSHAASSNAFVVPWPNATPASFRRCDVRVTSSTRVIAAAPSRDELLERRPVDVLQHVEVGDRDVLVDLVDARVDRTELDDLGADLRQKAAEIGRAHV